MSMPMSSDNVTETEDLIMTRFDQNNQCFTQIRRLVWLSVKFCIGFCMAVIVIFK